MTALVDAKSGAFTGTKSLKNEYSFVMTKVEDILIENIVKQCESIALLKSLQNELKLFTDADVVDANESIKKIREYINRNSLMFADSMRMKKYESDRAELYADNAAKRAVTEARNAAQRAVLTACKSLFNSYAESNVYCVTETEQSKAAEVVCSGLYEFAKRELKKFTKSVKIESIDDLINAMHDVEKLRDIIIYRFIDRRPEIEAFIEDAVRETKVYDDAYIIDNGGAVYSITLREKCKELYLTNKGMIEDYVEKHFPDEKVTVPGCKVLAIVRGSANKIGVVRNLDRGFDLPEFYNPELSEICNRDIPGIWRYVIPDFEGFSVAEQWEYLKDNIPAKIYQNEWDFDGAYYAYIEFAVRFTKAYFEACYRHTREKTKNAEEFAKISAGISTGISMIFKNIACVSIPNSKQKIAELPDGMACVSDVFWECILRTKTVSFASLNKRIWDTIKETKPFISSTHRAIVNDVRILKATADDRKDLSYEEMMDIYCVKFATAFSEMDGPEADFFADAKPLFDIASNITEDDVYKVAEKAGFCPTKTEVKTVIRYINHLSSNDMKIRADTMWHGMRSFVTKFICAKSGYKGFSKSCEIVWGMVCEALTNTTDQFDYTKDDFSDVIKSCICQLKKTGELKTDVDAFEFTKSVANVVQEVLGIYADDTEKERADMHAELEKVKAQYDDLTQCLFEATKEHAIVEIQEYKDGAEKARLRMIELQAKIAAINTGIKG